MNLKDVFNKITTNNNYLLVEGMYDVEMYLGLNDDFQKTIKYRSKFEPINIQGTKCIDAKQYKNENYSTIQFVLLDEDNASLFYLFCEDIIDTVKKTRKKESIYSTIIERYNRWKQMFSGSISQLLSEIQIMGLIGEIWYLKNKLFNEYGIANAIRGWTGQELTHKDYSYNNTWYEIKTISKSGKTVNISSIEQLDSDVDGYLVVIKLEKMSPIFHGISLNKIVNDTIAEITTIEDKELFINKITKQGYCHNPIYDNYVYNFVECNKFLVNQKFPRLLAKTIDKSILKANYEISLQGINSFKTKE